MSGIGLPKGMTSDEAYVAVEQVCYCAASTARDGHLHEDDGSVLCLHYEGEDGNRCPQALSIEGAPV